MVLGLDQRFNVIIQTQFLSVPVLSHLLCIGCSSSFSFRIIRWYSRSHTLKSKDKKEKLLLEHLFSLGMKVFLRSYL